MITTIICRSLEPSLDPSPSVFTSYFWSLLITVCSVDHSLLSETLFPVVTQLMSFLQFRLFRFFTDTLVNYFRRNSGTTRVNTLFSIFGLASSPFCLLRTSCLPQNFFRQTTLHFLPLQGCFSLHVVLQPLSTNEKIK